MVEIFDPSGKRLLERLLAKNPEFDEYLVAGQPSAEPYQTVHPRLHIPSAHPTIKTPLTIELSGHLQVFWYRGYFFDFVGLSNSIDEEAFKFIEKFFAEELLLSVCLKNGLVSSGGPIECSSTNDYKQWITSEGEMLEIRSWLGTHDQDLVMS